MFRIFKYLKKKDWSFVLGSLIFIVAQVWLDLKLPEFLSRITMLVQTKGSKLSEVWIAGGYMLLCALGSVAATSIVGFFAARVAADLSARLRSLVYDKVESFSMAEINKFSTASLITRSTNDITQVQMFISMGLSMIVKAPIMAVWAINKISNKSWEWTATTAVAVIVLLTMVTFVFVLAVPASQRIQKFTDNLNSVTRGNLIGIRVVRAYNAEKYEALKFEKANNELTDTNMFVNRVMSLMNPGMSLIMNGLGLAIYWIGAYLINAAEMKNKITIFSDMVVFSSYSMQVIMAFMTVTMVFIMFPRASVSAKRINEVIDTKASLVDGKGVKAETGKKGEVEFRNVSFKYPDAEGGEYVLSGINFKVSEGETVAFIGSTGSGKSTLINLVPRFYDATEGEILVDGINVKEYTQKELHNRVGYVPQKAVLFSGSISSNVVYGDNGKSTYSREEVQKAVEIAQGKEFVEKMTGTYDAPISQGGTNISGGQKQRLSIARAIYRKPEIYIFDDSFSALDYKTDRELRSMLKRETAGVTSLVVAQRIGTIIDADKIIVLDNGQIVGAGKHKELLESCKVYQEIAYSQLSKEELDLNGLARAD